MDSVKISQDNLATNPGLSGNQKEEPYGVFSGSSFSYSTEEYDRLGYKYNWVYQMPSNSTLVTQASLTLWDAIRRMFKDLFVNNSFSVVSTGPAYLLAIDSQGRRSGYNSTGSVINEIPNALVSSMDESWSLILPTNDSYQLQIGSTSQSVVNLDSKPMLDSSVTVAVFDPISEQEAGLLEYSSIRLESGVTGQISFAHGQKASTLALSNGELISPTFSLLNSPPYLLYLPVVSKK